MKRVIIGLLCGCLVLSLAAGVNAKKLRFAFMPGITDPFYFTMEKGAKAKAEDDVKLAGKRLAPLSCPI